MATTTTTWLAEALGRFAVPDPAEAPAGYDEEIHTALMTSAQSRAAFVEDLERAVDEVSGGSVRVSVADPSGWPEMSRDLGAVHLVLAGERRLFLAPAAEPVGFLDSGDAGGPASDPERIPDDRLRCGGGRPADGADRGRVAQGAGGPEAEAGPPADR